MTITMLLVMITQWQDVNSLDQALADSVCEKYLLDPYEMDRYLAECSCGACNEMLDRNDVLRGKHFDYDKARFLVLGLLCFECENKVKMVRKFTSKAQMLPSEALLVFQYLVECTKKEE